MLSQPYRWKDDTVSQVLCMLDFVGFKTKRYKYSIQQVILVFWCEVIIMNGVNMKNYLNIVFGQQPR